MDDKNSEGRPMQKSFLANAIINVCDNFSHKKASTFIEHPKEETCHRIVY